VLNARIKFYWKRKSKAYDAKPDSLESFKGKIGMDGSVE